jgi:hypothetical protein
MENDSLQGDLLHEKPAQAPAADSTEIKLKPLYLMLAAGLAAVVLISLGLSGLLIWQSRLVHVQLTQGRQTIANYQRADEPLIKDILGKLASFAQQNRDYQPVLQKYPVFFPRAQQTGPAPASKTPATSGTR